MSNVVTLDQNSNTGSDVIARVKALLEQSTVNLSSAAAFLQSVVGCLTIIGANVIVKKIDPDAGLF